MKKKKPMLPDVYVGLKGKPLPEPDWDKPDEEPDPDDEELEETPKEVVELLGFDPLEDEGASKE